MFITKEEFNTLTYPQVTQIIKTVFHFNGFAYSSQATRDATQRALAIGTITHDAISTMEAMINYKQKKEPMKLKLDILEDTSYWMKDKYVAEIYPDFMENPIIKSSVENCITNFTKWRTENIDLISVYNEQPIKNAVEPLATHRILNYRGIIDAIYEKKDKHYILTDYKTSAKISEEYIVQLMAYYISLPDDVRKKTNEVSILRIDKKSKVVDYIGTNPFVSNISLHAEEVFERALETFYLKEMLENEIFSLKAGE